MNTLLKILLTAVAVVILSYVLPGVSVESYWAAIITATVLGLFRVIVKPVLVIVTIPITIITLGIFLLFINAILIMLASWLLPGFEVTSIWWALIFSFLLSFLQSVLYSMLNDDKKGK